MGIQEEIFEEFIIKLKEEKDIPKSIIKKLGDILKSDEIITQELILELIEEGIANGS